MKDLFLISLCSLEWESRCRSNTTMLLKWCLVEYALGWCKQISTHGSQNEADNLQLRERHFNAVGTPFHSITIWNICIIKEGIPFVTFRALNITILIDGHKFHSRECCCVFLFWQKDHCAQWLFISASNCKKTAWFFQLFTCSHQKLNHCLSDSHLIKKIHRKYLNV